MTAPPLPIPLTDKQLQAIGETCAILGQIDLFMQETVMFLLNVSVPVAAAIMGSTDARARAGVFEQIIETKCQNKKIKEVSRQALKLFGQLSGQRNDFIHAYFGVLTRADTGSAVVKGIRFDGPPQPGGPSGLPVAIKVRTRKHKSAAAIEKLRDEAAEAAHLFHQIAIDSYSQWNAEHRASRGKS